MNNTSKTILATLALSLALVGCDNVVKNDKEGEAPVVEENTENAPAENAEEATDQKAEDQASENADENTEENAAEDTEENAEEDADQTEDDMADASDKDIRETLEQAIFDNRTQARAIEILLEMTPEQVADIKPELEQMLEDSNQLIDEAQATLDQLGN